MVDERVVLLTLGFLFELNGFLILEFWAVEAVEGAEGAGGAVGFGGGIRNLLLFLILQIQFHGLLSEDVVFFAVVEEGRGGLHFILFICICNLYFSIFTVVQLIAQWIWRLLIFDLGRFRVVFFRRVVFYMIIYNRKRQRLPCFLLIFRHFLLILGVFLAFLLIHIDNFGVGLLVELLLLRFIQILPDSVLDAFLGGLVELVDRKALPAFLLLSLYEVLLMERARFLLFRLVV